MAIRPPRRQRRCRAEHRTARSQSAALCCLLYSAAIRGVSPEARVVVISAGLADTSRRSVSTSPVRAASKLVGASSRCSSKHPGGADPRAPPGRLVLDRSCAHRAPRRRGTPSAVCLDRRAGDSRRAHARREMRRPHDQPASVPEARQRRPFFHDRRIEPGHRPARLPVQMRAPRPYSRPFANAISSARTVQGSSSSWRR